MERDESISRMFEVGLGNCPPIKRLLFFATNREVPEEDSRHIGLCPLCKKKLKLINEDKTMTAEYLLFADEKVAEEKEIKESVKKKKTEQLLDKDLDELEDAEVDGLFSYLIEQGVSAGAFSLSDLEKLDSIEVKRQLIKFLKEKLKK